MSAFGWVITDAMLQTAGIALLHSLWQSGLVALVTLLLLKMMQKATAQSRYLIAAVALLATLMLPVVTFIKLYQPATPSQPIIETSESVVSVVYTLADTQFHFESWLDRAEYFMLQLAPMFFWFWIAGMIFMALRMSGGYFLAYRYRRVGVIGVSYEWEKRLKQISDALHIKTKVVLLESVKITVPMVVGILKPCIILPIGTLSRLPFDQVEMILAHELAHIKRADFMVNIFQSLIETILFFNPFVWWISSVIRTERENICDDMALLTSGKNLSLAKALANLAAAVRPEAASQALITFNQINTMKRIERLIRKPKLKPSTHERIGVVIFSGLFVLLISTSGILTGSNSNDEAYKDVDQEVMQESSNLEAENSLKLFSTDTLTRKIQSIEVENKNGKVVKVLINGKDVNSDDIFNADFDWQTEEGGVEVKFVKDSITGNYKFYTVESTEAMTIKNEGDSYILSVEGKRTNPKMNSKTKTIVVNSMVNGDTLLSRTSKSFYRNDTIFIQNEQITAPTFPRVEGFFFSDDTISLDHLDADFTFGENYFDENDIREMKRNMREMMAEQRQQEAELQLQAGEMLKQAAELRKDAQKALAENEQETAELYREAAMELENESRNIRQMAQEMKAQNRARMIASPAPPAHVEGFYFGADNPTDHQYHLLLRQELVNEGLIEPRSNVMLSKRQLIVDNEVADKKTHRHVLKRFEELLGRKVTSDEAITLKK